MLVAAVGLVQGDAILAATPGATAPADADLDTTACGGRSPYLSYHPISDIFEKTFDADSPACSDNNTSTWCLEDLEYPGLGITHAAHYHYFSLLALYKDISLSTENSVDHLTTLEEETYLCPSETSYLRPLRAKNTDGKWRVIVNNVVVYNDIWTQSVRMEVCLAPAKACPLVPSCYDTKCLQKNILHRFLVYEPCDYSFPFALETFELPASCACLLGPYYL